MPETRSGTERPLVSVVLPTAGRSPWLGHAVRSALAQTYAGLEVVLVDDSREGQADQPWNLLWAGDERVRVLRTGGVGGATARQAGVEAARGGSLFWITMTNGCRRRSLGRWRRRTPPGPHAAMW